LYDTYVPLVPNIQTRFTYEEACELLLAAFQPLGEEYCSVLRRGLTEERWVDVYENRGKRSGAYSSGCYDTYPYMLMNYKEESLTDLFTLAHEAGHSMHSYFSCKHQPYQDYHYTIFVAEVASTFNEQLLLNHLRSVYKNDPAMIRYLVNHQVEDIKRTLYRQTMFAEFERAAHAVAERNEPLTKDTFTAVYGEILRKYSGPAMTVAEHSPLECLRIPHFYSAFYVYKYATGLSAAIALSDAVLSGASGARERYHAFLRAGCTKYPVELLKDAGVDITQPAPIRFALDRFDTLVSELS
jgi:oligoendopeptidase F